MSKCEQERMSDAAKRDTVLMLIHASAKLKLLAQDDQFAHQALTRFISEQIDDWCLNTAPEAERKMAHDLIHGKVEPKYIVSQS